MDDLFTQRVFARSAASATVLMFACKDALAANDLAIWLASPLAAPLFALLGAGAVLAFLTVRSMRLRDDRTLREVAQAAEARYSRMFHLLPDIVTMTDLATGYYVDVNDGWVTTIGYSREQTLGRTSADLGVWIDPSDRVRMVAGLEADGEIRNREMRFRARDGRVLDCICSGAVSESSGARLLTLITRDVTEERAAARVVREAQTRLQQIFEMSPVGMIVSEPEDGRIRYANRAAAQMLSQDSAANMIGRTGTELGFWEQDQTRIDVYAPLFAGSGAVQRAHHLRLPGRNARLLLMDASLFEFEQGQRVMIMLSDITERARVDRELRESEQRFEQIFQAIPAPATLIDIATMRYFDVNGAWCDFTGHRREEALGQRVASLATVVDETGREANRRTTRRSDPGRSGARRGRFVLLHAGGAMAREWRQRPIVAAACDPDSGVISIRRAATSPARTGQSLSWHR